MTSAIPWNAPVAPPPSGLLNTPGPVLAGWLFAFACALGLWLILGRTQETMAALWRPWAAWLGRLHVAVAGLGVWMVIGLMPDTWFPGQGHPSFPQPARPKPEEQLRRLAYRGYMRPVQT